MIIQLFTFDNQSLDLIDCPFVEMDEHLIILPSLTAQADVSRALASNFLNRNINMSFKGPQFEERSKVGLNGNGIKCSSIYKKTTETEYECDLAVVLDDELFFVECKAHVQPFTTRQHANHLYKLYEDTFQLNRIADYFEENQLIVNEQLKLDKNFIPKKAHRILLTTSMIGTPLFVNGVFIIDESSFTMFIDRTPPALKYFEKGQFTEFKSGKFKIYEGEITVQKMIEYLESPPQIKVTEELYDKRDLSFDLFDISRHIKVNDTMHFGAKLNKSDLSLLDKFY